MVGIILASHGGFAEGIKQSGEMIFGKQDNLEVATLLPSMGPDDFRAQLEEKVEKLATDEILFLVDLWGGTPFNQASSLLKGHEQKWAIVTGLNLPMLIEAFGARLSSESAQEVASSIIEAATDGVKIQPESLMPVKKDTAVQVNHAGEIPEGTVLGDGKIKFVLTRIDTRLLHGQVATTWTKLVNPDRIIVVSDDVAHDELRKSMIEQAAPPGVKAHCVPVAKMAEICKDPRFGLTKAMVLFQTPQDALELMNMGVKIDEINLGSMAHSQGKAYVTSTVSMGKDDIETFKKILEKGTKIDVRKVPGDQPEDFNKIMKKAESELKNN